MAELNKTIKFLLALYSFPENKSNLFATKLVELQLFHF